MELEREKFEAMSSAQMKDQEIARLSSELRQAIDAKSFIEDEVNALRQQVQEYQDKDNATFSLGRSSISMGEGLMDGDIFEMDSVVTLKEKVGLLMQRHTTHFYQPIGFSCR